MALGVQKSDIYGSTLTKGYDTSLRDRAVRRFRISGASNLLNQFSLGEAIDHLFEHLGGGNIGPEPNTSHPYHGAPIADITAVRVGPSKIDLVVRYIKRNTTGSIPPTLAARKRDTLVATEWYQYGFNVAADGEVTDAHLDGIPRGDVVFLNRDDPDLTTGRDVPKSYSWVRNGEDIFVPVTLDNQAHSVDVFRNSTNASTFSIAGKSYAPNTLLYKGKSTNVLNTGLTDIVFAFTSVEGEFLRQIAVFGTTWSFPIGDKYPRKNFNFPF